MDIMNERKKEENHFIIQVMKRHEDGENYIEMHIFVDKSHNLTLESFFFLPTLTDEKMYT